jgi:hypothetical protein
MVGRAFRSGACLLFVALGANAAEPRGDTAVSEFVAAINAKDAMRLKALLADNFVMSKRDPTCGAQQNDRDCMVGHLQRTLLKPNARLTVETLKSEREITRANLSISSDSISTAGVKQIAVTKEFVIVNGKIQSILTTLRTEDPETAAYKKRLSS